MWSKLKNWFRTTFQRHRHREVHVIIESPSSYYRKTGTMHPRADLVELHIGNVAGCRITERKAIITRITYLPPDRNYMYRFDGIGFDGHGWWSHHAYFIADNLEQYLESLKNNECKI